MKNSEQLLKQTRYGFYGFSLLICLVLLLSIAFSQGDINAAASSLIKCRYTTYSPGLDYYNFPFPQGLKTSNMYILGDASTLNGECRIRMATSFTISGVQVLQNSGTTSTLAFSDGNICIGGIPSGSVPSNVRIAFAFKSSNNACSTIKAGNYVLAGFRAITVGRGYFQGR
jgi:hypothetical protein